jgi:predicted RNase H-like nuclease (RuvC/YqgF family)
MANKIALVLTLVFLAVTCFFGYETHLKIGGLNDKVTQLGMQLSGAQQQLARTKADLSTSQDNLAKETADDEQTKAQLATVQSNLDAATAKATDLQTKIDQLNAQIAAGQGKPTAQPTLAIYTQAQMDAEIAKEKDAQAQVAELNQLKDTLTQKVKDDDARADDLQKIVDHYKSNILKNGLTGEVLAVNQGWNFVVLSIGDRQGAVANAELILQRGGSQIGKVRITSVEPSTSVADIIPGSLARGVRVQPGDQVIFTSNGS